MDIWVRVGKWAGNKSTKPHYISPVLSDISESSQLHTKVSGSRLSNEDVTIFFSSEDFSAIIVDRSFYRSAMTPAAQILAPSAVKFVRFETGNALVVKDQCRNAKTIIQK